MVSGNQSPEESADKKNGSCIFDIIESHNHRNPNAPAICSPGRKPFTYSRLFTFMGTTVSRLNAMGIGRKDRLAVVLPNGPEMATAFLGIAATATCAPLNPGFRSQEFDFYLKDLGTTALVLQKGISSAARTAALSHGIPIIEVSPIEEEPSGFFELVTNAPISFPKHEGPAESGDTALLLHTSGTTSLPKLVPLTQRNIAISAYNICSALTLSPQDRCLNVMPLFHIHGLIGALLSSMAAGACIVCTPGFYANEFFQWLSDSPVTWYTAVPTIHQAILARSQANQEIISRSRLRFIRSCSASLPPQVMMNLEETFGVPVIEAYGMTEASHQMASNPLPPGTRKPNSVGKAKGTEVSIADEAGNHLPLGSVGEVVIRGQGVTPGYENNPKANEKSFINGWFRTGDRGYLDEDGYLFLTGRIKEIINRAGEKISPLEIDQVLLDHPAVEQAVAFALPDPHLGEEVAAAVMLRAGKTATQRDLQKFVADRLADFKVPRKIVFLDEIPKGPTGKIQRIGLADRLGLSADPEVNVALEEFTPPRSPVEKEVFQIWANILGLQEISVHSNFFQMGGDSILAAQVLSRIREKTQVDLSFVTFLDAPTIADLAQALQSVEEEGMENIRNSVSLPRVIPAHHHRHEPFPLNDMQEAYWVGRSSSFQLGNVAAHSYTEIEQEGLDLERLNLAWQKLITRHDALRTIVLPDGRQQILKEVPFYRIQILDFSGMSLQDALLEVESLRRAMSHQVLKTGEWPLFDVRASRLQGLRTRLHISLDGMVLDAWSRSTLFRELSWLYLWPDRSLPPLNLSFRDYAMAQISIRDTELYRRSSEYWRKRLTSLPPAPQLPLAKAPDTIDTPRFERLSGRMDRDQWERAKTLVKQKGITPSILLLTSFSEILRLWSRGTRFTLNVPHFNRLPLHPQVGDILGEFASLTFLAVDNLAEDTFLGRARRLQRELWENLDHSHYSGPSILRDLAQLRGWRPGAIMPVVFTSIPQLGHSRGEPDPPPLGKTVYSISQTPQVQLDLQVFEEGGVLGFNWDFVGGLFPDGLMEEMFAAYCRLLEDLAVHEETWRRSWSGIARKLLPVVQIEERERINSTDSPIPDTLLHGLFEKRASLQPNHTAVIATDRVISYRELHSLALRMGHRLRALGAGPGNLVAVVMEKGWEQIVGVLGILFSGAAYLPLDPTQPEARLHDQLRDGQVTLAISQRRMEGLLHWPDGIHRIYVDTDEPVPVNCCPVPLQGQDDLAYVIYTSGSTGSPKGVMITHRSVVNAITDTNNRFHIGPGDRVLAVTALHHDMSVFDIFGTLAAGGTIVVPDRSDKPDPAYWLDLIEKESVTVWNSVPTAMQLMVEYAAGRKGINRSSLRLAFLGGDWIPLVLPGQIRTIFEGCQVISVGGPTETTLWNICYPISDIDPCWKSIPYGRPMANTKYYVLNETLDHCPVWVPGMLYCAGAGLAKGYWRDEEKTRSAFIQHPLTGERLYRTGDIGRFLPDGNIEILGREDFQVKVRGHRIELVEIEQALSGCLGVKKAVVKALREPQGDTQLAAYIVPMQGMQISEADLRMHLQKRLPSYMIPATFRTLHELPLTHTGKIDREALPEHSPAAAVRPPSSQALEGSVNRIGALVRQILKGDHIPPDANLLCLGATSVDMVRISNLLEKELAFRPRIDDFYRMPTIAALATSYENHLQGVRIGGLESGQSTAGRQQFSDLLLDPDEREDFRNSRPGLRKWNGESPSITLTVEEVDDALRKKYSERRTHRRYLPDPIPTNSFSGFLSCLRQLTLGGKPKYLYPSSGGLYCVQTYLYIKAGRVQGIPHGTYYYDPVQHRLMQLSAGTELDRIAYSRLVNRPIFDSAAFSIYLIAQLAAIAPLYGDESVRLATLDAGYMGQLIVTTAPAFGIGICPIGSLDFDRICHLFLLDESHNLIHSLLGGLMDPEEAPGQETLNSSKCSPVRMCRWEEGEI